MVIVKILCLLSTFHAHALFEHDQAVYQAQKNNWQQSTQTFKQLLVQKPDNPHVLYDAGVSSFKNNEYDQALAYFTKAAQSPGAATSLQEQAYFNAGNTQVKLKKLQEAIDDYDKVLAINPEHEKAKHNKGIVKKMLEQQKQEDQKQENKEQNNDQKNQEDQDKQEQQQQEEEKQKNQNQSDQEEKNNKDKKDQNQENKDDQQQNQKQEKKEEKEEKNKKEQEKNQPKQEEQKPEQQDAGAKGKEEKQENNEQKQLTPALARMLNEQEKKDAQLNKQIIKVMAGTQGGAIDDYNCW